MKIEQRRIYFADTYTISKIYIDGKYFCDAVEDTDRGLTSEMGLSEIAAIKVPGRTAIPTGTYEVTLDVVSPKFSRKSAYRPIGGKLPRLLGVKGFEGVLVHIGNRPEDTEGCLLVGHNTIRGAVTDSTRTFFALYKQMLAAKAVGEKILWQVTRTNAQ